MLYVLRTPKGKMIEETASEDKSKAQVKAFDYLYHATKWAKNFYKKWDGFIKERRRRGYRIVQARLEFVGTLTEKDELRNDDE